ncbi:ABC transporter substrate-binding protein [Lacibacterium aquatile]|uniref:ABC transporter substrate-binding protein n=1 Tax=Lacibacterium aquatile TaxID=1168082 RepID=A0ABW5DMT4_9PROT
MRLRLASTLVASLLAGAAAFPAVAQTKDTLTVGMPIEPPNLDPTAAAASAIREVTYRNVYEGLTRLDRNGQVQPALAESWTISDDKLTYTFKLRQNVKFHNGRAFVADDVKFSLDRAKDPQSTNPQKALFTAIDSVDVVDPHTVTVKLKAPTGLFLWNMAWGDASIFAKETVETNKTNPVGTGAYKFVSWTRGDRVVLEKNPDYRDAANVKMRQVTFRFIADAQAQSAALKAGDVDAFPNFGAPELFEEFKKDSKFTVVAGNTEGEIVAGMNNARKPFDDVRVRRALAMSIDRKSLIEAAYSGIGIPIGAHFSPAQPGYVDLTGVYKYDPPAAKKLLADAGYPNGFTATIKMPQMTYATRSAEILSSFFAEIGVTLKLEPIEFPGQWLDQVYKRTEYDMTIVAHTEPLDLGIYARDNYYFNYKNDAFKAIMAKVTTATDDKQRFEFLAEAQRKLAEDEPALFLFLLPKLGIWNAKLKGMWENQPLPVNDVVEASWQ